MGRFFVLPVPHGAWYSMRRTARKGAAMSDLDNPTNEQPTNDEEQPQGAPVDWKEMARKWEKLAKQNKGAADELATLKASQMTEQERLTKRAEDAEKLVEQYRADEQRREDAAQVATATGVPVALLLHCATREDMEQFATEYEQATHVKSAPPAPSSRIVRGGEGKTSTRDLFTEFMTQNFR